MGFSLVHVIILLIIILLFGGKRLPELGGALGKGLRSFKKGLEGRLEDEEPPLQVSEEKKAESDRAAAEKAAAEKAAVSAKAEHKDS